MAENKIGVGVATAVGLGAIIGAGIFVLSGTAIALAGSYALVSFVIVGLLAMIVALELGELGSIMPYTKGGVYSYTYEAFGSELGFITGILRYFSLATAISAIALGFGAYLSSLFNFSQTYSIPFAIVLIFVLSLVNIKGIKKAARMDFWLVAIKLGILTIFIIAAVLFAMHFNTFNASNFTATTQQTGLAAIFAASIAVFFAYSGFQTISTFTSKIKGEAIGAAKAIIFSVVISMVFYVLVVVALMLMMPAGKFTINADPLAAALNYVHAPYSLQVLIDIGALIATTSATLAMILASSRTVYQISENKLLPKILRKYNKKSDVAINGVILSAVIGVVMLFSGNIYIIAAISNFGILFSYLIISFAVIHFRRIKTKAPFRMPGFPYLSVIAIVMLLIFILSLPGEALDIGVVMLILLIVIYYFFRELKGKKVIRIELFK